MSTHESHAARTRPSFADGEEIAAFHQTLLRFERGEIDADAWRAYRVARGAYGQRQDGVHMLRIKLPQGAVTAPQLRALAEVTARYARGAGHVTTRQNYQAYFVQPAHLEPAMRRLEAAGVTTSGSGGNAVRNVVACPLAGVSRDEVFDVTPCAEAFTRHFLRHPLGNALPRKFKVAFEGCLRDHVPTAIQDLGFRARLRGGDAARGFAVTIAGGTSTLCTSGHLLFDFLPAGDILALGEAVVRIFHARGDRANRQRNRLKFLVQAMGFDAFQALVREELEAVRRAGAPGLPFDPDDPPVERAPGPGQRAALPPGGLGGGFAAGSSVPLTVADLATFQALQVHAQRQVGYSAVFVSLPQGDVTAAQLLALAHLAETHGDGAVRLAGAGQVVLRWVPDVEVSALHAGLVAAGLGRDGAGSAADVVACPGADVCRLAVTRTRALASALERRVRVQIGPPATVARLPVHVSGCPNGCGQHHLAAIGLQGSARRLGERVVPQYFFLLGGHVGPGIAQFGRVAAKIPVRRVPEAYERLVRLYVAERLPGEEAGPFFAREFERARELLAPLEALHPDGVGPEDLVEPGTTEDFRVETQQGECAA